MKPAFFAAFCEKILALQAEQPDVRIRMKIQTNSVLVNKAWFEYDNSDDNADNPKYPSEEMF